MLLGKFLDIEDIIISRTYFTLVYFKFFRVPNKCFTACMVHRLIFSDKYIQREYRNNREIVVVVKSGVEN